MAITLKDGTVLPDIPVVASAAHKYFIICKISGDMASFQYGSSEVYTVTIVSSPFVCELADVNGSGNDVISCEAVGTYSFFSNGGAWTKDNGTDENGYLEVAMNTPLGSLYGGMAVFELLYSNHDILTTTGEIYFANCEAPAFEYEPFYLAPSDWVVSVADQARRLGGVSGKMDKDTILATFKAVPDPSGETVDELAKSIVERTITSLNNEDFTTIGSSGMRHCDKLTDVVLPNVTTLNQYAFYQCTALKNVELQKMTHITGNYVFGNCSALEQMRFPSAERLGGTYTFYGCTALKALIFPNENTVSEVSDSGLWGSTIESGTGFVYVPAALLDSYKAATNWSTYAAQFRALEDYTVDGTVTGALDETKI